MLTISVSLLMAYMVRKGFEELNGLYLFFAMIFDVLIFMNLTGEI